MMQTYEIYITTTVGGNLDQYTYRAVSIENLRKRLLEEYGKRTYVHIYVALRMDNGRLKDMGELDKWIDPMLWRPAGRKTWYMLDPKNGRTAGPWTKTDAMKYKLVMAKAGRY